MGKNYWWIFGEIVSDSVIPAKAGIQVSEFETDSVPA